MPYILYSDGTKYGYFEKATLIRNNEKSDLIGCINNNKYSIYIHSNLKYSIFLNNLQEGLILQSHWKQGDGDIYEVLYNSKLSSKNAALICILIDILYSTLDTSRSTISYQNVTVHGEKNKDECYWTPEK